MAFTGKSKRPISLRIDPAIHIELMRIAEKRGGSVSAVAESFITAAYAAHCGISQDAPDLDTAVKRCMVAWGAGFAVETIAIAAGVSEETVAQIIEAWKAVIAERRA